MKLDKLLYLINSALHSFMNILIVNALRRLIKLRYLFSIMGILMILSKHFSRRYV